MSLFFTSDQISIYRQRRIGSTNRYSVSATFTAYNADIQPADRERTEMVNGSYGATFVAYVDSNVEIKEGDEIRTDGKKYLVKGVSDFKSVGLLEHKELIIVSQNA